MDYACHLLIENNFMRLKKQAQNTSMPIWILIALQPCVDVFVKKLY